MNKQSLSDCLHDHDGLLTYPTDRSLDLGIAQPIELFKYAIEHIRGAL